MKRDIAELVTQACLITAGDHVEMPEADELPDIPPLKEWSDEMPRFKGIPCGFPPYDEEPELRPMEGT